MKQETFTDIEYSYRKKKTKREEFLEIMEEIIPWDEWVGVIQPYYPKGKRGRPSMGIERLFIQRFPNNNIAQDVCGNKGFFDEAIQNVTLCGTSAERGNTPAPVRRQCTKP